MRLFARLILRMRLQAQHRRLRPAVVANLAVAVRERND